MNSIVEKIQVAWEHRVFFTKNVFAFENPLLRDLLAVGDYGKNLRVLVLVDAEINRLNERLRSSIESYFEQPGVPRLTEILALPGGEKVKSSWGEVSKIHAAIERNHIDRHSYLLAIGGGAFLDVAGLAAATAHRGVRHVRLPSTTMGQCDSGVGVKNGINLFGKKNFVGTFAPPFAVVNDFEFLSTLPTRDLRSGFSEAVKVACIRSAEFFGALEKDAPALAACDPDAVQRLVKRSAELHVLHIAQGGDPFETGSSRPLDFGHWAAHKLEQISGFTIRHGEAVAIGIAVDVTYAKLAGFLKACVAERILGLLRGLGFSLFSEGLTIGSETGLRVLEGLDEFREHLGGKLCITLLKDIGVSFDVDQVDKKLVRAAIADLAISENLR